MSLGFNKNKVRFLWLLIVVSVHFILLLRAESWVTSYLLIDVEVWVGLRLGWGFIEALVESWSCF